MARKEEEEGGRGGLKLKEAEEGGGRGKEREGRVVESEEL